jgi:hypothetical protein
MRASAPCSLRTSCNLVPCCSHASFVASSHAKTHRRCTPSIHMSAAERFRHSKPLQSSQQAVKSLQQWMLVRCRALVFVPWLAALKASAKRLLLALAACVVLHTSQHSVASMVQPQPPVPHLQQGVVASLYAESGAAAPGAYSSSAAQNAVAYSSQQADTLSAQEVGLRFWRSDAPERTANDVLMDEVISMLKKKYGESTCSLYSTSIALLILGAFSCIQLSMHSSC